MSKQVMRALIALILLLAGASVCTAADKNIFKDLPGVAPPKGFSTQSQERQDCTCQLVSPYYHGHRELPVRMYSCKNGLVTYESTILPAPPGGDPYVHGENLQGFPGTGN
ncbi:MAG TPA: hypothetical protein VN112_20455 [Ensifer sp.]|nr:hypothetical protein [Ensifer sp.]